MKETDTTASLDQIAFLYSQLSEIQGTGDVWLMAALNNVRQIGCLLEGVMGRKHAWKKPKFAELDPMPLSFEQAQDCLTIYVETTDGATLADASRFSTKILEIIGKIKKEEKRPTIQTEASPSVVICNVLETARINVDKRIKGWSEFNPQCRERTAKVIADMRSWLNGLAALTQSHAPA